MAIPEPNSGCLLWMGNSEFNRGYGALYSSADKKMVAAHRLSYKLNKGHIPAGLCVCHSCDVTACINPEHLFLGTTQDNTADMVKKGRNHVPTSRLFTDAEVLEIFRDGRSYCEIEKDYAVSYSTISCIKRGRQWGKVTGKIYETKKQCSRGHPWTADNVASRSDGTRYCKLCNRERALNNYYGRGKK